MNSRVFACLDCKQYIDSAYRWGYWQLEDPGIVRIGQPVDIDAILTCGPYWDCGVEGPSPSQWLEKLLPQVRAFLTAHREHTVVYCETADALEAGHHEAERIT